MIKFHVQAQQKLKLVGVHVITNGNRLIFLFFFQIPNITSMPFAFLISESVIISGEISKENLMHICGVDLLG